MRIIDTDDSNLFLLEAKPLRGRAFYCAAVALLVGAIVYGRGPFSGIDVFTRVFAVLVIGGMTLLYACGRFGTIIDRENRSLCNWYECLGLGIRWTFPIKPASVRIECRMGGHRDVSDLQYTRHLFLLNRFGPPLRIGRLKGVAEARQLAQAIASFLNVPIEEGTCKPADQVCVPLPWANLGYGFFRGARLFLGHRLPF